jgi:hypothetical protein
VSTTQIYPSGIPSPLPDPFHHKHTNIEKRVIIASLKTEVYPHLTHSEPSKSDQHHTPSYINLYQTCGFIIKMLIIIIRQNGTISVAARCKKNNVFGRPNSVSWVPVPLRTWITSALPLFVLCVGRGLAINRSPVKGVLACLKRLYSYFQKLILNWNRPEGLIHRGQGEEMGIQLDYTKKFRRLSQGTNNTVNESGM